VLAGEYPGNASKRRSVLTVEPPESEQPTLAVVEANGSGKTADPTAIRPALAQPRIWTGSAPC
jgi:hypothetical protein